MKKREMIEGLAQDAQMRGDAPEMRSARGFRLAATNRVRRAGEPTVPVVDEPKKGRPAVIIPPKRKSAGGKR